MNSAEIRFTNTMTEFIRSSFSPRVVLFYYFTLFGIHRQQKKVQFGRCTLFALFVSMMIAVLCDGYLTTLTRFTKLPFWVETCTRYIPAP